VMITRHTSALLVLGDKLVTDKLEGKDDFMKKANDKARKGKAVACKDNDPIFSKSGKLRELLLDFQAHGCFIELPKAEHPAKDADKALAAVEKEEDEEEQAMVEDLLDDEVVEPEVMEGEVVD
jgi:hypothetical protein